MSIRAFLADVNIRMRNITPIKTSKKHQDVPSSLFGERITRPEKKGNKKQGNKPTTLRKISKTSGGVAGELWFAGVFSDVMNWAATCTAL